MVGVTGSILVVPTTHTLWLCGEINDRSTIGILKACAQYSRIGAVSADGQAANSPILSPMVRPLMGGQFDAFCLHQAVLRNLRRKLLLRCSLTGFGGLDVGGSLCALSPAAEVPRERGQRRIANRTITVPCNSTGARAMRSARVVHSSKMQSLHSPWRRRR